MRKLIHDATWENSKQIICGQINTIRRDKKGNSKCHFRNGIFKCKNMIMTFDSVG